jgi:ABC-2 type transport system permease protein
MKSFIALIRREFIEHKGAFFYAPLGLVAVILALALFAFGVNRVDLTTTGQLATVVPTWVFEASYAALAGAWLLYLAFVLFFYCADGFAADKRNNAMLFWKSMPVSDFKILMSKLTAAVTLLPGTVFGVALISLALLYGVAYVASVIAGLGSGELFAAILGSFGQMSLLFLAVLASGLLWYLPYMALVGAMATAVGRWAIPLAFFVPTLVSSIEWVTLGGAHPFATRTWEFLNYRSQLPIDTDYIGSVLDGATSWNTSAFMAHFLSTYDWMQAGLGVILAFIFMLAAAQYRRRSAAN